MRALLLKVVPLPWTRRTDVLLKPERQNRVEAQRHRVAELHYWPLGAHLRSFPARLTGEHFITALGPLYCCCQPTNQHSRLRAGGVAPSAAANPRAGGVALSAAANPRAAQHQAAGLFLNRQVRNVRKSSPTSLHVPWLTALVTRQQYPTCVPGLLGVPLCPRPLPVPPAPCSAETNARAEVAVVAGRNRKLFRRWECLPPSSSRLSLRSNHGD